MKQKLLNLLTLALMASGLVFVASCADDSEGGDNKPHKGIAEYTMIMYACAGGDLDGSILGEIYENYAQFGDTVKLAVIYKGSEDLQTALDVEGIGGCRYFTTELNDGITAKTTGLHYTHCCYIDSIASQIKDKELQKIKYREVRLDWSKYFFSDFKSEEYEEADLEMNDPAVIAEAIKYVAQKNPAKKYILIANNHGGGWMANRDTPLTRAMVYDDNRGVEAISLDQLNEGVRLSGIKFEAIFCDLCLMAYMENLTGYSIQNGGQFKFAIASAEVTSGSRIGNLAEQLKVKGADISDDEFYSVIKDWVTRADGKGYMKEWSRYSKFDYEKGEAPQSMGAFDLRNISSLTDIIKEAAEWYTASYDDTNLQAVIDAAILNSNYVVLPYYDNDYLFFKGRNAYWNKIGLNGSQITEYAITGRINEVKEKVFAVPDEENDLFKKSSMNYGITLAHFMRETIERGNANGLTEKVKPLQDIYNQYLSTLKGLSAIKCTFDDYKDMDAYVWTSPTVTLFPMNEYYRFDDTLFPVPLAHKDNKFNLEQCLASYNATQFDQKTGWSNFLKKITVAPCVLTNPIRSSAIYENFDK